MQSLTLLDSPGRLIAVLRHDGILHGLALFVLDSERLVGGGIYEFHLDLAVRAVVRLVGRLLSEDVLVAERLVNRSKNLPVFAFETREVCLPAGLLGEGAHLIVS